MSDVLIAAGSCLVAGAISTLHPCPLTTNISSVTMLVGGFAGGGRRGLTLVFFVSGYLASYLVLSVLLSTGVLTLPGASIFLQRSVSRITGPFLVLIGMLLADLLNLNRLYRGRILTRLSSGNRTGYSSFPFGALVALSFCPATASIFFGVLVPLSVKYGQNLLFPLLYALGASLPLIIISVIILRGIRLTRLPFLEKHLPRITGWILILIGIILTVQRIFLG